MSEPHAADVVPIAAADVDTAALAPTEVRMAEIVFPNHTNHMGTLFGGQALAWMDKAAFLAAARYSRHTVVTARSDQVDFKLPIRQGQMVETIGRIVEVGRSSMRVEVELIAEDLASGERKLCTRGHFVMIALGPDGKPTAVAPLPKSLDTSDVA
jgi:acyl-CoA hydrolase